MYADSIKSNDGFIIKSKKMKKSILLVLFAMFTTFAFSQVTTNDTNVSYYVATGLSFTNSSDFNNSSYFSVEGGVNVDNVAFGVVLGRNNLNGALSPGDSFNNYWYEGKVAVYQQVGSVDAYGLLGVGSYVQNGDIFLEYGLGISRELNDNVGVFIQVSNWDGVTYTTPGVFYSF